MLAIGCVKKPMTPQAVKELKAKAAAVRRARAAIAREDPAAFAEFILRDELTGKRVKLAPLHTKWHELATAYNRLVIWAGIDLGKTQHITIARTLWELGRNPNQRVIIISKTTSLARKITRTIGQYISNSEAVREVFPKLRPHPDPAQTWTSVSLTVDRGGNISAKDPSVSATGTFGNIHGNRAEIVIFDDAIDSENTGSQVTRDHVWNWIRSVVLGRLSEEARLWALGNAWHPDDLLHRLEREPRFVGFRFPVISPDGVLAWPEHWPHSRVENQRIDMGPLEFARACLCQARDDETARFKRAYIDKCVGLGAGFDLHENSVSLRVALENAGWIERGDWNAEGEHAARMLGERFASDTGVALYTGVDLAVSRKDVSDRTVLFTIAAMPDGRKLVVNVRAGRWGAPEILENIKQCWEDFGSMFVVENNAAQDYIVQLLTDQTNIPILPFTTGRNKANPEFGIDGMAAEFAAGKWIVPSAKGTGVTGKEVAVWIGEMAGYDPRMHTGDSLMASWFASYGARMGTPINRPPASSTEGGDGEYRWPGEARGF